MTSTEPPEPGRVLITGASQGLGVAIAREFLRHRAAVFLCARGADALRAAHAALAAEFPEGRILSRVCDVSREDQVGELADAALRELGALDALVLNAGVYGPMGPTEEVDLAEWRRALEINLFGVLLPCRALIPAFKAQGRGKIVVLAGGGATAPMPNISAYAASKAAVVRLAETLAEELRAFHIDVNAIAPGALATRMMDEVLAAGPGKVGAAFFEKNRAWKENGAVPLELGARLAVFLAGAESDGITGKLISAQWDPWAGLAARKSDLAGDIYTLRRIVPGDRGRSWGD